MAGNPQNASLTLQVYRGSELLRTLEPNAPSVTIGSGPEATLSLTDTDLAPLHAVINVGADGAVQVADLKGDGDLQLNDETVANAPLKDGDRIKLADLEIRVAIGAPTDAASRTATAPHDDAVAGPEAEGFADEDELEDEQTDESEAVTEDVMAFIMRSGTAQSNLGVDKKRPKVLEVNQIWSNALLDTKHYAKAGDPITIGTSVGYRWNLLGVDLAWVPPALATVLPWLPPMWSEVRSEWRNDFYAPDDTLPVGQHHTLLKWQGKHYVAEVGQDWDGFVDRGGERYTFAQLAESGQATKGNGTYQIPIDDDTRFMADVSGVKFFAHMVYPSNRVLSRATDSIDYGFMSLLAFFLFLGSVLGFMAYFVPAPPHSDMHDIDDRFVELMIDRPEEDRDDSGPQDAGEGEKAEEDEGKVGKQDEEMEQAKGDVVEMQQQERDREIAEEAGLLGALRDSPDLDGHGAVSDAAGAVGGLIGARGSQMGAGGLASRGSGLGGGGSAEGIGGLGTRGRGGGESGFGDQRGEFGRGGEGEIAAVQGDPIILGALDRSLIDEVVRRHYNAIRFCYQRQLSRDPGIAGRIVIRFTIAGDGSVSQARVNQTTMNNEAVESCVAERFMRMQFPEPRGGGIVVVNYPFVFSS